MISSLNNNSSFLTSKNAMEILGVSIVTLRKWSKDGTINTIRTSGNHRLYDVKSYLRECENLKGENLKETKSNNDNKDVNKDVKNILKKSVQKSYSKIKKEININNDVNSNLSSDEDIDLDDKKINVCYINYFSDNDKINNDKINKDNKLYLQQKYKNYTLIEDENNCITSDFKKPGLTKIINLALDKKILNLVILSKDNLSYNNYNLIEYIIKNHSNGNIINENKFEPVTTTTLTLDKIIGIIDNYKNNLEK